jgi:hypothetical protein
VESGLGRVIEVIFGCVVALAVSWLNGDDLAGAGRRYGTEGGGSALNIGGDGCGDQLGGYRQIPPHRLLSSIPGGERFFIGIVALQCDSALRISCKRTISTLTKS